jgi:hypothetical protein
MVNFVAIVVEKSRFLYLYWVRFANPRAAVTALYVAIRFDSIMTQIIFFVFVHFVTVFVGTMKVNAYCVRLCRRSVRRNLTTSPTKISAAFAVNPSSRLSPGWLSLHELCIDGTNLKITYT